MSIDFSNLPEFEMPLPLLTKLFDCTGFGDGTRGFILCYLTQSGEPEIAKLVESSTPELAIERYLEFYLERRKEDEIYPPMFGIDEDPTIGPDED